MSSKKYTAEQLRVAREIVDQEEAIAAERERRQQQRRNRVVKEVSRTLGRSTTSDSSMSLRTRKALQRGLIGLIVFWAINGYFRLSEISSETSLYRSVLVWAIPLSWLVIVWVVWHNNGKVRKKPDKKSGKYSGSDYLLFVVVIVLFFWVLTILGR